MTKMKRLITHLRIKENWSEEQLIKKCRQWHNQSYRERPICRANIEKLLTQGFTLEEISMGWVKRGTLMFSEGLRKQARKMMKESGLMFILAYQTDP